MSRFRLNRREVLGMLGAAAVARPARAEGGLLAVTRVDHVALSVGDIDKSMAFYRRLFGNEVLKDGRTPRRYLRMGPVYAAIAPVPAGEAKRIDHFCFGIPNFQAAAVKTTLEKAGHKVRESNVGLFITDPDGISIQLWSDQSWKELSNATPEAGPRQDPLFRARGMHHLVVRVSDVEKSGAFYTKLLGTEIRRQGNPPAPWFQAGESTFGLYAPVPGKGPAIDHFCALVDPFDPAAAAKTLQSLGADAKLSKNGTLPEFYDPEGIRLQVMTPPAASQK